MKDLVPYLRRMALDAGILAGSRNYVKFIILSRSRTGSVYLRSLLSSHSQINIFGELFQKPNEINWGFPEAFRTQKTRKLFQKNPVLFLEKEIFRTYPKNIKAVGFKIFYYHAQTTEWRPVWAYLEHQKDLKIIHLKRKNILRTHLSRKNADYTGRWVNLTGEREDVEPIILNSEECLDVFKTTREWENRHDSIFQNHSKLIVYYENLCKDTETELHQIQKFLGVDEEELRSKTYQQITRPLSHTILNYWELKEQFRDTVWAEFFEE